MQGFGEPKAMAWQAEEQPVSPPYKFEIRISKSETNSNFE
jgi:hypothetical protein